MGIILSKFRKKKTTYEVLEKLDDEIKSIEEFRRSTEQTHKKIVGRFVLISIFVYLFTAIVIYFYFFPASVYERLLYIVPLILAPVVIISIKRVLTWYYDRKLNKKSRKLVTLKDEKKKLLEDVMDKETYKVATSILEKFAPDQFRRNSMFESTPIKVTTQTPTLLGDDKIKQLRYRPPLIPSTVQRKRFLSNPDNAFGSSTPLPPISSSSLKKSISQATPVQKNNTSPSPPSYSTVPQMSIVPYGGGGGGGSIPGTPLLLPRAILSRDRTVFDKLVDYLVGDGPSNRYALICRQCSSHNGMAVKEEFDYLTFRCCYCTALNPARKRRPDGPKLQQQQQQSDLVTDQSLIEDVQSSSSSSDDDLDTSSKLTSSTIMDVDYDNNTNSYQNNENGLGQTFVVSEGVGVGAATAIVDDKDDDKDEDQIIIDDKQKESIIVDNEVKTDDDHNN